MLAPVALFVYNRADNTRKTLQHLLANTLAKDTDLYVFSDGGKDPKSWQQVNEVRTMLHQFKEKVEQTHALRSMILIERPENIYLERNITEGIAQVFETHDRIIVLEDDICTSPYYLQYMNQAFDHGQQRTDNGQRTMDNGAGLVLFHPSHVRLGVGNLARPLATALCSLPEPSRSPRRDDS